MWHALATYVADDTPRPAIATDSGLYDLRDAARADAGPLVARREDDVAGLLRRTEAVLAHVLDPNREVQPAYAQYVAVDLQGGVHTGILAADAATSVTLRREKGLEETLLKADLDEWRGTDRSLMPEGFEKTISIAEMGNLLAFLDQTRYDRGTDPGHEEPTGDAP